MKNVLVIYYSQSGQLLEIAQQVTKKLENAKNVNLNFYSIKPQKEFSFPWDGTAFYNAFPESFLQIPVALEDLDNPLLQKSYDLIIFAYQIWYLTPSIPANSFLKTKIAKTLFADTPVITLIGARNMWIMAQEKVKKLLQNNKAKLVGNIALIDKHINHISVITIERWMLTGKKEKYLGVFPKPGVADKDIQESEKFGAIILASTLSNKFEILQAMLLDKGAVKINPFLLSVDKRANVLFRKWANFILKKGDSNSKQRLSRVTLFTFYLKFVIWIIAPVVFIVYLLTYFPLYRKIQKSKQYYSSINLEE